MKSPAATAFLHQFVVYVVLTTVIAGSLALCIVWQRHENARLANANRTAKARLADLDRRITQSVSLVEGEKSSDVLQRRAREWQLGLAAASGAQVQRVLEDPMRRLARRRGRELLGESPAPLTLTVALGN
ncbi:MAG: hypothetical protein RLZZ15_4422 [Verrucomicrobiota bacterium]